jgi:hypothetical protein
MPSYRIKYETDPSHSLYLRTQRHSYTTLIGSIQRYTLYIATHLHCPHTPIAFLHMLERTTEAVGAMVAALDDVLGDVDSVLNRDALRLAVAGKEASVVGPGKEDGYIGIKAVAVAAAAGGGGGGRWAES